MHGSLASNGFPRLYCVLEKLELRDLLNNHIREDTVIQNSFNHLCVVYEPLSSIYNNESPRLHPHATALRHYSQNSMTLLCKLFRWTSQIQFWEWKPWAHALWCMTVLGIQCIQCECKRTGASWGLSLLPLTNPALCVQQQASFSMQKSQAKQEWYREGRASQNKWPKPEDC